jgi:hypothetical protein
MCTLAQVDIYAFGMCMLEMITKERPYSECNNAAQVSLSALDFFSVCSLKRNRIVCLHSVTVHSNRCALSNAARQRHRSTWLYSQ